MISRLSVFAMYVLLSSQLLAQQGDEILMTIHDRNITLDEFERVYNKNNSSTAIEQLSVGEYLELFINFKLKVIEAEELGYDTTQAFIREFTGYQKQLARPYLSDRDEFELLVREAYERSKYDVHASHIMIRCSPDAAPRDTALAYAKAFEIRQRILNGEDFATVARATSEDPSAKTNGGDLGFFTVFMMIYPFETAAYSTGPGEISLPVRTGFGYHLIKVHERRPAKGKVRVAHIMVMTPEDMPREQLEAAERKIYQLFDSLDIGADFAELARRYSEDPGSAAQGGELSWFGTGRMVPEFEEAAFTLENPGDLSKPVKTDFGWHIIKLIDQQGIGDFESMKSELRDMVNRSDRADYSRRAMFQRMKYEYNFTEFRERIKDLYSMVDQDIFRGTWSAPEDTSLEKPLFIIDGNDYTQKHFFRYLEEHQGGSPINKVIYLNRKYDEFLEQSLIAYEEQKLPEKYPEYRHLLQEYHDGILLFELTDKMVWSKAIEDTAGLERFYKNHQDDHMWGERLDAVIYTCKDKAVAERARQLFADNENRHADPLNMAARICNGMNRDIDCMAFTEGQFERGDNEFVDRMDWERDRSEVYEQEGAYVLVVKRKELEPGPKSLDEVRGLITADYQNHLEKQWIAQLREKYPIHVNKKLLRKIK